MSLGPTVRCIAAVALMAGCTSPTSLVVDVRTDLVPGVEFDSVRTEVVDGINTGLSVEHAVVVGASYALGMRVAELAELDGAALTIQVSLLREGLVVLERPVRVALASSANAVTILIAGGCANVTCTGAQACLAGRCVDDRCTETTVEFCVPECSSDSDCAVTAACAAAECTASGTCFAAPDHDFCGAGAFCVPDAGCVRFENDLAAGLNVNLIAGSGIGTDAVQEGNGGFWYHYHPASSFGRYGPLSDDDMDPAGWRLMEQARDSVRAGWLTSMGTVGLGMRGIVYLNQWGSGDVVEGGDALTISPENAAQPVVEWRAPTRGLAELDFEVHVRTDDARADVEVHIFVVRSAGAVELDSAYLSGDGAPDENSQATALATLAQPRRLQAGAVLEAGEGIFLYVRVGDDDAFDTAFFRGVVRFTPESG